MTSIAEATEQSLSAPINRLAVAGEKLDVLADIYEEEVNIATWQRAVPATIADAAKKVLQKKPKLQISLSLSPHNALENLIDRLDSTPESTALATDIAELVDMFCCLFGLNHVGLRLTALGQAMCPRFHVDRVPCRLVTTYIGSATEWLPHDRVDRGKLGPGSQGLPDDQSGLYSRSEDIHQLVAGDVALLKGECWIGNEDAGLVHRSPQLESGAQRLLLTLDFANN